MKTTYFSILVLAVLIGCCTPVKESTPTTLPENPLFVKTNQPIDFDQLTGEVI